MGKTSKKRIQAATAAALTLSLALGTTPAWAADKNTNAQSALAVRESVPAPVELTKEQVKISKEEAEARMKELFPLLNKANLGQISSSGNSYPPANETIWNLSWSVTREDGQGSHGFSTQMDAMTGDVLSMHIPNDLLTEPTYYPPKVSREEALETAKALVRKAVPTLKNSELKEKPQYAPFERALFGPYIYSFYFETEHNGIPVSLQSVDVSIDGNGNIVGFSYRPLPGGVPETAKPIAKDQALDAYVEQLDLHLSYVNVNLYRDTPKWVLAWVPSPSSMNIMDASTGEWLSYDGAPIATGNESVQYEPITSKQGSTLQPKQPQGDAISRQQAETMVSSAFPVPDDYELVSHSLYKDPYLGTQVWQLNWRQERTHPLGFPPGIWATVDAETGQIYEVRKDAYPPFGHQDEPESPAGEPITREEAQRIADELVAKLYPNANESLKRVEGVLRDRPTRPDSEKYQFTYQLFRNDIPVQNFNVHVQLSQDGTLETYSARHYAPLPKAAELPKQPALEKGDAKRLWLERSDLSLQYDRFGGFVTSTGEPVEETVRLTYRHTWKENNHPAVLDAITGEWISTALPASNSNSETIIPKDIENHYAEEDLAVLASFRVLDLDEEGNANPDDVLTRGQWAHWLASAIQPYYLETYYHPQESEEKPYFQDVPVDGDLHKALRVLAQQNWMNADNDDRSSFGPDEALTKEELAVWAMHVLNYDRLAEFLKHDPEINAVNDIDNIAHPGAAALAVKLDLLPIETNAWKPDREITRAEAASLLMELVRLQSSIDQPVNGRVY